MPLVIPRDPLGRFLDIATALGAEKRWWEHRQIVRYAAVALVVASGEPAAVAARAAEAGRKLAENAGWFSELKGSLRYVVVAMLAAAGRDASAFQRACAALRERFRRAGVRRGREYEVIAAAMLHVAGAESDAHVETLKRIYDTMKAHHWWLTGPDDLPACALLTVHGGDVQAMPARIEALYDRLRRAGLRAGDGLQLASHVLHLAAGSVDAVAERFLALHRSFVAAGVTMWDCDRDELALLCLLGEEPAPTVERVLAHRTQIRAKLGFVGPTTGFSYACGTAFLAAHAGKTIGEALARDVRVASLAMATNAVHFLQQARGAAAGAAT